MSAGAALAGSFGLQAAVSNTNSKYVQDNSPNAESRYRARFYFDPNSAAMSNGHTQFIFMAFDDSLTVNNDMIRLRLYYQNGYRLRIEGRQDNGSLTYGTYQNFSDQPHYFEVDWQAASNGRLDLWIDGVAADTIYLTNGQRRIDTVRLGPQVVGSGGAGTLFFDAFDSRRVNYIGPLALAQPLEAAMRPLQPDPFASLASLLPRLGSILERLWQWLTAWLNRPPAAAQPVILQAVPAGQVWRNYIFAGAQRVAVREYTATISTVYYILGDHLGSTTVVANDDGSLYSKQLYKPWGEIRYTYGSIPTQHQFTGQKNMAAIGLYHYGARWYDPSLTRFLQADSLIPGAGNPLAWDRYAYTLNAPTRYTDPSGHNPKCGPDGAYCDQDEWNDYMYDPVGLSNGGNLIITIARELERLTGRGVSLFTIMRLIFERELAGFGEMRGIPGVFAEAAARGYWHWADTTYGIHSKGTLINWLGAHNQSAKSLHTDLFVNLPAGKIATGLGGIIGRTRNFAGNVNFAYQIATKVLNPPAEWQEFNPDAPYSFAFCKKLGPCMIPDPGKRVEFWALKDTQPSNNGYIFSADLANVYFKRGVSYIATYNQLYYYWNR